MAGWLALSASVAAAACPTRPADLDPPPADQIVVELHALRQDLADVCAADEASARDIAVAVMDAGTNAHSDARTLAELLDAVHIRQGEPVALTLGGGRDRPLYVATAEPAEGTATVALASDDREAMHADAEQQRFALWFLAGVCCVVLAAPIFRRVWLP